MTFRELLEHELAWYKGIAKLRFLGGWKVKLKGKRLTVIVYKATPIPNEKLNKLRGGDYRPVQYRLAASYGKNILTSIILDRK
jgi:hypothetical protein